MVSPVGPQQPEPWCISSQQALPARSLVLPQQLVPWVPSVQHTLPGAMVTTPQQLGSPSLSQQAGP
jgi:hypothetical protein